MADVDFAKVEQPDELIQLAWNAGLDKKAVIREGSFAASMLDSRSDAAELFWPVPHVLEAVDRWVGAARASTSINGPLRPFASSLVPSCVLGYLITHYFVAPRMSEHAGLTAEVLIIIASNIVLGVVFKILIEVTVRRWASRLDEERALVIVLRLLRRGMVKRPKLVPHTVKWIREGLARTTDVPPKT